MRAVAEILWSSGNEPRSMKYSLRMVLSSENFRLFWRQSSTSASESKIEWPSDHFVSVLSQTPARHPRSEPPITFRAIGNPPQPLTNCNSRNHIKSVVVYRLKGNNIGHDFSCLNHTLFRNMTFFFSSPIFTQVLGTIFLSETKQTSLNVCASMKTWFWQVYRLPCTHQRKNIYIYIDR